MPIEPYTSRQSRVMLALWRKAAETEEGFTFQLPSKALAISTRQELYRSLKRFRGRPDLDPVLCDVGDRFVATLVDSSVAFRPRRVLAALEAMFDDLGLEESDFLTKDEREVQASIDRLTSSPPIPRSTPFFTRED